MIEEKIASLVKLFANLTLDQKYEKIIELGKNAPPMKDKTKELLVAGCQSQTYLYTCSEDDWVHFTGTSDALISAGLIQLLIQVYSGERPETILQHQPDYLKELDIYANLSPTRSNGLASMHLRMKQDTLALLIDRNRPHIIDRGDWVDPLDDLHAQHK